jgi:uncharacterized protein YuzE
MKWTYDPGVGAMYVRLRDGAAALQEEVGSVVCDLDQNGELLGVEVLGNEGVLEALGALDRRFDFDEDTRQQVADLLLSPILLVRVGGGQPTLVPQTAGDQPTSRVELASA